MTRQTEAALRLVFTMTMIEPATKAAVTEALQRHSAGEAMRFVVRRLVAAAEAFLHSRTQEEYTCRRRCASLQRTLLAYPFPYPTMK